MNNFKSAAVTILAFLGGWYVWQRFNKNKIEVGSNSIAIQRMAVGAKAQEDAAKAAALGGTKALADQKASEGVKKS